jgi:hypothetical protein
MEAFQCQYDGTDFVSDLITQMVEYISLETPIQRSRELTAVENSESGAGPLQEKPSGAIAAVNDWGDVFLRQPTLYLRLTLTVDHSLSSARFPDESDFPPALQLKNQTEKSFPRYRISMNRSDDAANCPIPTANPQGSPGNLMNVSESASDSLNPSFGNTADVTPTVMDSFDFESKGLGPPMGFEAFDFDMGSKRGFGFDYPAAWNYDNSMFPESCDGLS